MNSLLLVLLAAVVLLGAYLTYGRWLARKWGIDAKRPTPAVEYEDGVDYVPSKRGVVFGHQFASIAGAGPINGPIIAAMFGWLPVLLWILFGGIFFGAVQDFAAMYASVKNKGKSIGYIIEQYIGKTGKKLFLLFVWLFSILVVAAFADIVAGTFAGFDAAGAHVQANGAVATTSVLFIAAAVGLGFLLKRFKLNGWASAGVAVALLAACIAVGLLFPIYFSHSFWLYFVFVYIMIASVAPVWALLQPRDYMNSFLLLALIVGAFVGVIVARPVINLPAFTAFEVNGSYLFPALFITIACGAVSGFHSLVASGTASKQIANERDMLPISFGAMLLECMLAVLALVAVGALAVGGEMPTGTPPVIFATAFAGFLATVGLPESGAYTLITLAISAFALTSLDSVARVGRLSFQELFIDTEKDVSTQTPLVRVLSNKYFATIATLVPGLLLALVGYQSIWPLFGSANQLLAALSLIACAVFLKRTNRAGWMLYVPMVLMLIVTFTSLCMTIWDKGARLLAGNFAPMADGLQLVFAVLLLALGIMVAVQGIARLRQRAPQRV